MCDKVRRRLEAQGFTSDQVREISIFQLNFSHATGGRTSYIDAVRLYELYEAYGNDRCATAAEEFAYFRREMEDPGARVTRRDVMEALLRFRGVEVEAPC